MEPVGGSRCGVLKACAVCDGHALWDTLHAVVFGCAGVHQRERGWGVLSVLAHVRRTA